MTFNYCIISGSLKNTYDVLVMRYKILCCCYMLVFNTSPGGVSSHKY